MAAGRYPAEMNLFRGGNTLTNINGSVSGGDGSVSGGDGNRMPLSLGVPPSEIEENAETYAAGLGLTEDEYIHYATWYKDYDYAVYDATHNAVVLIKYEGSDRDLTVYGQCIPDDHPDQIFETWVGGIYNNKDSESKDEYEDTDSSDDGDPNTHSMAMKRVETKTDEYEGFQKEYWCDNCGKSVETPLYGRLCPDCYNTVTERDKLDAKGEKIPLYEQEEYYECRNCHAEFATGSSQCANCNEYYTLQYKQRDKLDMSGNPIPRYKVVVSEVPDVETGIWYGTGVENITFKEKVVFNRKCYYMFYGLKNLRTVTFEKGIRHGICKDGPAYNMTASHMFEKCTNLTEIIGMDQFAMANPLDTGRFDADTRIWFTDTSYMFSECESLKSIDFTEFTANKEVLNPDRYATTGDGGSTAFDLASMGRMFYGCKSLKEIKGLENFNTMYTSSMAYMFSGCESLEELPIGTWNTQSVTNDNMARMFENCRSLRTLELTQFDTDNINTMSYMFSGCESLEELDISSFDTGKVTNMARMFENCRSLKRLVWDKDKFQTGKVKTMSYMFAGCESLPTVDLTGFDTGNVTNMANMFKDCRSLSAVSGLDSCDTSQVTTISNIFDGCIGLLSFDFTWFTGIEGENLNNIIANCSGMRYLDLSGFTINTLDSEKKTKELGVRKCNALEVLKTPVLNTELNNIKLPGRFVEVTDTITSYMDSYRSVTGYDPMDASLVLTELPVSESSKTLVRVYEVKYYSEDRHTLLYTYYWTPGSDGSGVDTKTENGRWVFSDGKSAEELSDIRRDMTVYVSSSKSVPDPTPDPSPDPTPDPSPDPAPNPSPSSSPEQTPGTGTNPVPPDNGPTENGDELDDVPKSGDDSRFQQPADHGRSETAEGPDDIILGQKGEIKTQSFTAVIAALILLASLSFAFGLSMTKREKDEC